MTKLPAFAVGNAVEVYFGCVFRTVFKDVTRRTVTIPIEYRVIPEEVDTGRIILLGWALKDWISRPLPFHHELTKHGIKCERLELQTQASISYAEETHRVTVVGDSEIFVPEGERCKVVRQVEGLWKGLDGRRRETLTEFHANGVVAARSEGDLWVRPLGSGSGPAVLEGLASLAHGRCALILQAPEDDPLYLEPSQVVAELVAVSSGILELPGRGNRRNSPGDILGSCSARPGRGGSAHVCPRVGHAFRTAIGTAWLT